MRTLILLVIVNIALVSYLSYNSLKTLNAIREHYEFTVAIMVDSLERSKEYETFRASIKSCRTSF